MMSIRVKRKGAFIYTLYSVYPSTSLSQLIRETMQQ